MQQLLSSINFCLSNIGYLFILCVPIITLEVALASLIGSIDIQTSSDSAAIEEDSELVQSIVPVLQVLQNDYNSAFLTDRQIEQMRAQMTQQQGQR